MKKIVSDALGFPKYQLETFEADRKLNNFSGIEFRDDPDVPGFCQTVCDSTHERDKYAKHRGLFDQRGLRGDCDTVTPEVLEAGRQAILQRYPPPEN